MSRPRADPRQRRCLLPPEARRGGAGGPCGRLALLSWQLSWQLGLLCKAASGKRGAKAAAGRAWFRFPPLALCRHCLSPLETPGEAIPRGKGVEPNPLPASPGPHPRSSPSPQPCHGRCRPAEPRSHQAPRGKERLWSAVVSPSPPGAAAGSAPPSQQHRGCSRASAPLRQVPG